MVKTISESLGDINFGITEFGTSAAVHAKCLVCDKPVSSSQRVRTANTTSRGSTGNNVSPTLANSRSLPQIGYDKTLEMNSLIKPSVGKANKSRVATDFAIIRSSVDPLPEITDSIAESPRFNHHPPQSTSDQLYKERIRSSAGGGIGPSYKADSR